MVFANHRLGLIRRATYDYIVAMAFARQLHNRRQFELAAFSLPAIVAYLTLLLIAHGHIANKATIVGASLPRKSAIGALPTLEATVIAPPALPNVKAMPFVGLGPTPPPQKPEVAPSQPHAIIVRVGHSLWKIARETYGNGRDYPVIFEANRKTIAKPELIYPGQQLVLPDKRAN